MRHSQDFRLIRFLAVHAVVGVAIAVVTVALILFGDVGGLRGLIMRSDAGGLALGVMLAFFAITFASVQMSVALMLHMTGSGGGRTRWRTPSAIAPPRALQPVRATARRR